MIMMVWILPYDRMIMMVRILTNDQMIMMVRILPMIMVMMARFLPYDRMIMMVRILPDDRMIMMVRILPDDNARLECPIDVIDEDKRHRPPSRLNAVESIAFLLHFHIYHQRHQC